MVIQNIFWAETPLLEAVNVEENAVKELRTVMTGAIRSANVPLAAYAHKYDEFLDINNMDVRQFIKQV